MIIQELTIDNDNPLGPLKINFYGNHEAEHTIIFADGNPSNKDHASGTLHEIVESLENTNAFSFTYRGEEHFETCVLCQSNDDLTKVFNYVSAQLTPSGITLIATSAGAYPTLHLLTSSTKLSNKLHNVILLDPGDYELHSINYHPAVSTWSGFENYSPNKPTVVSLLNEIQLNVTIHVVNFMLRIVDEDGYVPPEERHIDHPGKYARLNNDMVNAFYKNTPEKNRGKYIEDHQLPHAFERDGDLKKNRERVVELVIECIK